MPKNLFPEDDRGNDANEGEYVTLPPENDDEVEDWPEDLFGDDEDKDGGLISSVKQRAFKYADTREPKKTTPNQQADVARSRGSQVSRSNYTRDGFGRNATQNATALAETPFSKTPQSRFSFSSPILEEVNRKAEKIQAEMKAEFEEDPEGQLEKAKAKFHKYGRYGDKIDTIENAAETVMLGIGKAVKDSFIKDWGNFLNPRNDEVAMRLYVGDEAYEKRKENNAVEGVIEDATMYLMNNNIAKQYKNAPLLLKMCLDAVVNSKLLPNLAKTQYSLLDIENSPIKKPKIETYNYNENEVWMDVANEPGIGVLPDGTIVRGKEVSKKTLDDFEKWLNGDNAEHDFSIPDVTESVNNFMKESIEKFKPIKDKSLLTQYWEFYKYVKSEAPGDLKVQEPYKNHSLVIYDGEIVNVDALGNIAFGHLGEYLGFPDVILAAGAGFAQLWKGTAKPEYYATLFDDPRDFRRVRQGAEMYDSEYFG